MNILISQPHTASHATLKKSAHLYIQYAVYRFQGSALSDILVIAAAIAGGSFDHIYLTRKALQ